MKKKSKILGSFAALIVSVAMLTFGVFAASSVSLDVTSSVSFEAKGVYIKVNGQIQKGISDSALSNASEPEGADYTYIGYSYDAIDEELETDSQTSDYNDAPSGSSSNPTMTPWNIGEISFNETDKVMRYSFTFKNYSPFDVTAKITNNISTLQSEFGSDVTIEESAVGSLNIAAYDGVDAQTATYNVTLYLNNFSSSFSESLTIDFTFEQFENPFPTYEEGFNTEDFGDVTYTFVDIGRYPQSYVGDTLNQRLENWYENQTHVDTYTSYDAFLTSPFVNPQLNPPLTYYAYEYTDGETYVRVPSVKTYNMNTYNYMNGDQAVHGSTAWFKVEPIKWRVLTQNFNGQNVSYLLSEFALAADAPFYYDVRATNGNNYGTSDLRTFITDYFLQEAFTEEERSLIVGRNFTDAEIDYANNISVDASINNELVWVPTRDDMLNSDYDFSTTEDGGIGNARLCSPSDYALASRAMILNEDHKSVHNHLCTAYWLASSAEGTTYKEAYYTYTGNVTGTAVYIWQTAIRPGMLFNLG